MRKIADHTLTQENQFDHTPSREMGPIKPPVGKTTITHIDKDGFWALMAQAREQCGANVHSEYLWLEEKLSSMMPEQALRFQLFMRGYRDAAYKYGLWNAACVLSQGCSDDGFIDFRCWLIAQGKEVYLNALKDPDSLANVEPYDDCAFEGLSYLGDSIYEEMTGRSTYDESIPQTLQAELAAVESEITYGVHIDYPLEWHELESHLPKLCAKYLTPEIIQENIAQGAMIWNPGSLEVRLLRELHGPKRDKAQRRKGGDAR